MMSVKGSMEETVDTSDNNPNSPDDLDNKPLIKYAYNKNKSKKPRRNKSAFILFSIDARVKLKEDPSGVNSNEMMVKLADMWKNLEEKEKSKYTNQAKNDKIRYLKELENFWKENPQEMLQNKTKKNHVKKPCSGYALYLKEVKEEVKKTDPNLKMADVLKIVSERWKTLDEKKKEVYLQEAERAKEISRAKLGESVMKNNVDKSLLLKKKKARHINEVKKQVKMDSSVEISIEGLTSEVKPVPKPQPVTKPPVLIPEKTTNSSSSGLPSLYDPQLLLERLINPQSHIVKPEPIKIPTNPLVARDHLVPQFRPFTIGDHSKEPLTQNHPPSFLNHAPLVISQPNNELPLQTKKSLMSLSGLISKQSQPQPKEEDNNAASLLQLLDKTVKTSSELLMDLLNFDSNPGRAASNELINASSLRINSNPFASTVESVSRAAPKFSRAEMLNNAILSALGVEESKAEDDCTNPGLLSLIMPK